MRKGKGRVLRYLEDQESTPTEIRGRMEQRPCLSLHLWICAFQSRLSLLCLYVLILMHSRCYDVISSVLDAMGKR